MAYIPNMSVYGTYSQRPTAGVAGRIFRPSDGFCSYLDTGSTWLPLIQGVAGVQPLAASNFTALNASGTSALVDNNGVLVASDDTLTSSIPNYRIWYSSLNSTSTVESLWWNSPSLTTWNSTSTSYTFAGIVLRESSTGKVALLMTTYFPGGSIPIISCEYATSATTGRTIIGSESDKRLLPTYPASQLYFRINASGSNILYQYSLGRAQWTSIASVAKTTAFTTAPDQFGLVVWPYNSNNPSSARIVVPHLATY